MSRKDQTKTQLLEEIAALKRRIGELEAGGAPGTTSGQSGTAEARFRGLVEQTFMGIFILQDGRCRYANPKAAEIFGYAQQDFVSGIAVTDLVYEKDLPQITELVRELLDGNIRNGHAMFRCVRKDGGVIEIDSQLAVADYEGGPAIAGTLLDITNRRKLESDVEQARRLESLSAFAGSIANEFNNILTAIIGNLAIAKMYAKPGYEVHDVLAEAENASFRARDLTSQLLAFSSGGRDLLVRKIVPVAPALRGLQDLPRANPAVSVDLVIPDELWHVEADEPKLVEAVSQIFVHAQSITLSGGILRMYAENIQVAEQQNLPLRSGPYVMISIEAQGAVNAPKGAGKVFDPSQVQFSSLGLANAYALIRNHKGLVTANSVFGRGTTFRIYLPAVDRAEPPVQLDESPQVTGKVLVMDDEEIIRLVVARLLQQCGYEADLARNGEEMIAMYKKAKLDGAPYAVVILDLKIQEGMSGQEAIGYLLKFDPHARAIVSSGFPNDPAMTDYRKFGFHGSLAKPYKLEELRQALHNVTNA